MAKIKLSDGGFTVIPEGEHIFKITKVEYDQTFGKVVADLVTSKGQKHKETYSLINTEGETNEGALNAFSFFAKTALNNFNLDEIDHKDLEGCYIRAEIGHTVLPNKNDPEKTVTFANIVKQYPASGFEKETESAEVESESDDTGGFDLDALLG